MMHSIWAKTDRKASEKRAKLQPADLLPPVAVPTEEGTFRDALAPPPRVTYTTS